MTTMHDQITDRLSAYLDGELSDAERASIEAHLQTCADCRAVLTDLRSIVAAASRLPETAPDRELWEDVSRQIAGSRVGCSRYLHNVETSSARPGTVAVQRRASPR